jgi:inositol phosphorylceramide mannosyltransferase catalytic subunit
MPPDFVLNSPSRILPVFRQGAAVPKIIHQVYFPGRPPAIIQENVDKIRKLNPGWEHRLYDDGDMVDFIGFHYGAWALSYFNRINRKYGAARADLFRYLLMYKMGGLYLDIKSSIERPLDEVLRPDDVYLLSRWRNAEGELYEGWGIHDQLKQMGGNEFQQWHIIAIAGHPFLRAVIEKVQQNIDDYNPFRHDTGKNGVLWITGPIAYTQSIAPLLREYRHRIVDSQEELGFTYSIFGAPSDRAHKAIFKSHYTELKEPIAKLVGMKKLLWALFGPVQNQVIQRVRDFFEALIRRLAIKSVRRG